MHTREINDFDAVVKAMRRLGFVLAADVLRDRWFTYSAAEREAIKRKWNVS